MLPPLPLDDEKWRCRWLQFGDVGELHRVSSIEWEDGEMIYGEGATVCGQVGQLSMPGIFSRMGAPRCKACCRALGLPEGDGAPYNSNLPD
jgi:hypothetical protein